MDFLDPKKQKMHRIRLVIGYVLIAVALGIATTILLYEAYGFGIDKNGNVIQNGLVFLSSQPNPATISVNGVASKTQTNSRLQLPAGQYTIRLDRTGYRTWQREVTVAGGDVQHFDYPFLFPSQLTATSLKQYQSAPSLISETPDRHWAIVQDSTTMNDFELYDLTKPKVAPTALSLPKGMLAEGDGQSLKEVEWSTDNQHLLLKHAYQKSGAAQSEYIMLDRTDPTQSFNLTKALGTNPDLVELRNKAYDQYWLYNQPAETLSTATLKVPTPVLYADHVLNFKPYSSDMVLYASDQATVAGKIGIRLRQGSSTYNIRDVTPSTSPYLIDLAQYSGDWYVLAGSSADGKVYIYKNPVDQAQNQPNVLPTGLRVLKLANPTYAAFSANTQYIMAEGGTAFSVYDIFNEHQYSYNTKLPLDAPQSHAVWMDAARLTYVSGGKQIVLDYDGTNQQTLEDDAATYAPLFDRDYKYVYTLVAQPAAATAGKPASTSYHFNETPLRTAQDQ
ncbi:MAG TPA: PEGA domain-containing protein [Candidatus Saccharimonadales bacterium]|nr:PEGA domain-containing protein [Candidatus Saccharimonadales bacterium]